MKRIHKYQIPLEYLTVLTGGFLRVLCVQMQNDTICIWAEVSDEAPVRELQINLVGTGQELSYFIGDYLGTVQRDSYVWHVYYKICNGQAL